MTQRVSTGTRATRVFFWVVVALLVVGIVWQGSSIVLSLVRQSAVVNEQAARRNAYAATATAIAPGSASTAEATGEAKAGLHLKQENATPIVQVIATNTPPAPALVPVEDPNDDARPRS